MRGIMSVTFFKTLQGRFTVWKDPPPQNTINTPLYGNLQNVTPTNQTYGYHTIDGQGPHNWAPLNNFEFLHPGALGPLILGPTNPQASFPLDPHIQSSNTYNVGIHNFPMAGPPGPLTSRSGHNNFYGYRVPAKGVLLGYTLDFIAEANDGIFHVFYWNPSENDGKVRFCKGGPIVCAHPNGELPYASGHTSMVSKNEIPIDENGYIFAASDMSYFRFPDGLEGVNINGVNGGMWANHGWTAPAPFSAPNGNCHITIHVRFNSN
jgi:hypothetical protein